MPFETVRFECVLGGYSMPSKNVDLHRDLFEVHGIDTAAIAAEMVESEAISDGPDQEFVGIAMRHKSLIVDVKNSIPTIVRGQRPVPTRIAVEEGSILVDLGPEVGLGVSWGWHTVGSPNGGSYPASGMM